jgi:hypothetical protein
LLQRLLRVCLRGAALSLRVRRLLLALLALTFDDLLHDVRRMVGDDAADGRPNGPPTPPRAK